MCCDVFHVNKLIFFRRDNTILGLFITFSVRAFCFMSRAFFPFGQLRRFFLSLTFLMLRDRVDRMQMAGNGAGQFTHPCFATVMLMHFLPRWLSGALCSGWEEIYKTRPVAVYWPEFSLFYRFYRLPHFWLLWHVMDWNNHLTCSPMAYRLNGKHPSILSSSSAREASGTFRHRVSIQWLAWLSPVEDWEISSDGFRVFKLGCIPFWWAAIWNRRLTQHVIFLRWIELW